MNSSSIYWYLVVKNLWFLKCMFNCKEGPCRFLQCTLPCVSKNFNAPAKWNLKFEEILICEDIHYCITSIASPKLYWLCMVDVFKKKKPHPCLCTGDADRRLTFKTYMNFIKFYFSEHHDRRTPDLNRISARDEQRWNYNVVKPQATYSCICFCI